MAATRWLSDTDLDEIAITGGKGASLGNLLRLGMPVPNGYVVTSTAYDIEVKRWRLGEALSPPLEKHDWAAVERVATEIISSGDLTAGLRDSVLTAYTQLGCASVAVRSSATAEDLDDASFAGQHDSSLNVRDEDALLKSIRNCWASLWSERAVRYRHEHSIDHASVRMAVIVQQMVQSDVAGVLFTMDPVTQQRERMHVEAAAGLGDAVVSGTSRTRVYLVDRSTCLPCEVIKEGSLLRVQQLSELCRLALEIERHKRAPQDIEFAFSDGNLFILQARAITTITDHVGPEPLPVLGDPSLADKLMRPVAAERYAMAPRPFDNIVFVRVVGAVIYAIRQLGGAISAEDEAAFRAQIWRQAYRLPPVRLTARFLLAQFKYLSLLKQDWLAWWASGFREELERVCVLPDLTATSEGELFECVDRILAVWEKALNERFYVSSAMNARPWLERIVGLVIGREQRAQVLANLMSGLHTPTSEVNEALWQLSRVARQDDAIRKAVRDLRPEAIPSTTSGEKFRADFSTFIEKYGHREGAGYYVSTPTWKRDPIQALRLISSLVEVDARVDSSEVVQQRYEAARALVERRLRFLPGVHGVFCWLLERLRAVDTFRETSHFDITRPLAALQEIVAELARRLRKRALLHKEDDLFYLTYEEVRNWCIDNCPPAPDMNKLLARRHATYELANARWQGERIEAVPLPGSVLKGVPASRGVASGRARVIYEARDFASLQPGEVLVCPYSNPGWTPLFISAAAVISETGGAASHAAIVAREYGIPAVMSVRGAMHALEHGPTVVVDGARGVVQIVQPE